jgi:hypothetical protein
MEERREINHEVSETPFGAGTVKIYTDEVVIFDFIILGDDGETETVEKVVDRELVNLSDDERLPRGFAMWYTEEFSVDGQTVVEADKFCARL